MFILVDMINPRWKTRKGVTLIGELIAFLFLIGIGYLLGGVLIFTKGVSEGWGVFEARTIDYDLTVYSGFLPVKHQDAVLAFLECTDPNTGIPMKRILTAAVVQNISKPYIPENFGTIDIQNAANDILSASKWGEGAFVLLLRMPTGTVHLAGDWSKCKEKEVIRLQKVSIVIFSPFEKGNLELYSCG